MGLCQGSRSKHLLNAVPGACWAWSVPVPNAGDRVGAGFLGLAAQPVLAGSAAAARGLRERGQVTVELLLTAGTHVAIPCVAVDERYRGNPSREQPANPKPSCEAAGALWTAGCSSWHLKVTNCSKMLCTGVLSTSETPGYRQKSGTSFWAGEQANLPKIVIPGLGLLLLMRHLRARHCIPPLRLLLL